MYRAVNEKKRLPARGPEIRQNNMDTPTHTRTHQTSSSSSSKRAAQQIETLH